MKTLKEKLIDIVKVYEKNILTMTPGKDCSRLVGPRVRVDMRALSGDFNVSHINRVLEQFLITYLNAWYDCNLAKPFTQEKVESFKKGLENSISSLLIGIGNYIIKVNCTWIDFPAFYTIIIEHKD